MRIFFTRGRIIDGRGGLIERGSVLVEGQQIVACGADLPTPRDADHVIDGDPLHDIEALQHGVRLVMKGGTIYRHEVT